MCVVFRHVANNTRCLRRVGMECWILWGWSYRWLWGAGTWAVVLCQRSMCSSLLSHTLALHLLFLFLPNVFNFFFLSVLKWTLFAPQVAIWWNMFKIISQSRWLLFSVVDWPQVPVYPLCPGAKNLHVHIWDTKGKVGKRRWGSYWVRGCLIGFVSDFPCLWVEVS